MPASRVVTDTQMESFYVRKTDGTNSTIQKLSDDLAKKKISTDEMMNFPTSERKQSYDRKSSKGSDSLWADLRRLSEAGVRRASDSSIVLTEDTDSFIIGDRVWVGGTKPGRLAYIGETQFAPGDWAGIVLDDPIGKNDGSVAGVRYFQCESKKGVFSRLTRLTRKPLPGGDTTDGAPPPVTTTRPVTSPVAATPSRTSTAHATPATAHRMSTSQRGSISGSSGTPSAELKVGDRVIVMSSQGSKAGMLRYVGTTHFQVGQWCGVELDDPLGKNDGSVAGTRYFDCLPNFGLFAPLHKVSKSPAGGRKASAATPCVMHPAGSKKGAAHHGGSRESLNSMASTAASSVKSSASRVRLGVTSLGRTSTPLRTLRSSQNDASANDKGKSPLQVRVVKVYYPDWEPGYY